MMARTDIIMLWVVYTATAVNKRDKEDICSDVRGHERYRPRDDRNQELCLE